MDLPEQSVAFGCPASALARSSDTSCMRAVASAIAASWRTAQQLDIIEMRIGKVVALKSDDHLFQCIVRDEVIGERHLVIRVGDAEAFSLAASLRACNGGRPMTYQFVAALLGGLGARPSGSDRPPGSGCLRRDG